MNARVIHSLLLGCLGATLTPLPAAPPPFFFTNTTPAWLTNGNRIAPKLSRRPNGDWRLDLSVVRGQRYAIDASADLRQWTTLTNFASATKKLRWIDWGSRRLPNRFYRVAPRGFHLISRLPDGSLDLVLGVKSDREYVIETSTDHNHWVPWQRFFSPGPVVRFQHQPPSDAGSFFCRARQTGSNQLQLQSDGTYLLMSTQTVAQAHLVEVSTNLHDWSPLLRFIGAGQTRRFPASEIFPVQRVYRLTSGPVNEVYDAFIILGQSNAVGVDTLANREPSDPSVWMFGLDYEFKMAFEPLFDSTGQIDTVNLHAGITAGGLWGHSWSLRAAKGITFALGNRLLLIPAAAGGTTIQQWLPGANRYDRSTLFGCANYRRSLAAPGGLKGIWYYGHESSTHPPSNTNDYTSLWHQWVSELRQDYGPVPIIYAQLALSTDPWLADYMFAGAEKQRAMETGYGDTNALSDHFMVVTFDLPMVDFVHLSRAAVDTLATRFALATREHIYGEKINGTGPRLVSLTHPGADKAKIKIAFTRPINPAFNDYDNQFRVYENGVGLSIHGVQRDADPRAVLITLPAPANGPVEVSYGGSTVPQLGVGLSHVVRDSDGLPAPMFRRLPVVTEATEQ